MSLLTQLILTEKYGLRLTVEQLARDVLHITHGAARNQLHAGTFPIVTYLDGGKRWADVRDVAEHLDAMRARAREAAGLPVAS
jgi:hypothetical protein